jgi:uncharacterized membrane protein YhiD involved in acid resistance
MLQDLLRDTSDTGGRQLFSVAHILLVLGWSFFLSLLLAYVYRQTHRGLSYSVSFVHTMIIMGVTVAIIMMVIGSNIARAFSLVGALSIIRFRTAIKDARDVAFIFMTMAVGMACGTGFYDVALVFVLFAMPMVYLLHRFKIGAMPTSEALLKVQLPENRDHRSVFNEVFYKFLREHSLLSMEPVQGGTALELVYSIHFKKDTDEGQFLEAVRSVNDNRKVLLLAGQQNVDI